MGLPVKIKLTDWELLKHIKKHLQECDSYELTDIAQNMFGGNLEWSEKDTYDSTANPEHENVYIFTPNDQYGGEFGEMDW